MSIHIGAGKGEIAETVLLPGDPLRAQWIAKTFFENPVRYNEVRGMYGFTGTYCGKKISVQGTGMGIPSTLIYCHELINFFGVKNLIRVGSAGSFQEEVKLRDIVIAMAASTNSAINKPRFLGADFAPTANYNLFLKAALYAEKQGIPIKAGNILSSDDFYEEDPKGFQKWAEYGVLCVEMETAGLYSIAAKYKVNALAILTISDSLVTGEVTTALERERTFKTMVEIALSTL